MLNTDIKIAIQSEPMEAEVMFDEPMSKHTSLRIGGPADVMVIPHTVDALIKAKNLASRLGINCFVLGGGTNILVSDGGIEGMVIYPADLHEIIVELDVPAEITLRVGAGVRLQKLLAFSRRLGLEGLEGLAGVPGLVGGAVAGNAGSYGCEIADALIELTAIDNYGRRVILKKADMNISYRNLGLEPGWIIIDVLFKFSRGMSDEVGQRMNECLKKKKGAQPVGLLSAGCVFKNPQNDSAGRLIDKAGLKGMRQGDIEVSTQHGAFFINKGSGTASDYLALIETVKQKVSEEFNITLEPEIKVVGR